MASEQGLVGMEQPDVQNHQLRFVTYGGDRNARWGVDWYQEDSARAGMHQQPGSSLSCPLSPANILRASMRIAQAPASFCQPVTQKKSFKPPFKVRLDFRYTGKLQLPVKIEVVAVPEQIVEHILKHEQSGGVVVPGHLSQQQIELENGCISSCLQTHEEDFEPGEKCYSEEMEFTELRFAKSSRMNRRWIMFTCKLGRDVLYTLYKLPTIVLSRRTDQYHKACGILLQKEQPSCATQPVIDLLASTSFLSAEHGRSQLLQSTKPQLPGIIHDVYPLCMQEDQLNYEQFITQAGVQQYIQSTYAKSGLSRPLTKEDIISLEVKSGLRSIPRSGSTGIVTDMASWVEFKSWFEPCLKSLEYVDHLWSANDITRICTFTVDRSFSEKALKDEPHGTFLVRLCSEPGAFAISTKVHLEGGDPEVKHVLVDALDLKNQKLERWVSANSWAENLLDIKNGFHVPKAMAFPEDNATTVGSLLEFAHDICQPAAQETSSPKWSSGISMDMGTSVIEHDVQFRNDGLCRERSITSCEGIGFSQMQDTAGQGMHFASTHNILNEELHHLMAESGLTLQDLYSINTEKMSKNVVSKKRTLSTACIDANMSVGEIQRKRQAVANPNSPFCDNAFPLFSAPPCTIPQANTFKQINTIDI